MTTWFTADTHFGHANIIRYCDRPFETKEEHDETLIKNWNERVQPNDHVYHLGDVGFGPPEYLRKLLARLKGKIHLIEGNHDGPATSPECSKRFVFIKPVHYKKLYTANRAVEVFMSHYPHRSWPKSFHGSFHLFGHVHGKLPPHGLSFDAGVDCHNFCPISLEEVVIKMNILDANKNRVL